MEKQSLLTISQKKLNKLEAKLRMNLQLENIIRITIFRIRKKQLMIFC